MYLAKNWVDRVILDSVGRSLKSEIWPPNDRCKIRKLVKSWPLFWRSWTRWRNLMHVVVKFRWKWRCILSSFYDLVTCGVTRFFRKFWLSWFIRAQNATKNSDKVKNINLTPIWPQNSQKYQIFSNSNSIWPQYDPKKITFESTIILMKLKTRRDVLVQRFQQCSKILPRPNCSPGPSLKLVTYNDCFAKYFMSISGLVFSSFQRTK